MKHVFVLMTLVFLFGTQAFAVELGKSDVIDAHREVKFYKYGRAEGIPADHVNVVVEIKKGGVSAGKHTIHMPEKQAEKMADQSDLLTEYLNAGGSLEMDANPKPEDFEKAIAKIKAGSPDDQNRLITAWENFYGSQMKVQKDMYKSCQETRFQEFKSQRQGGGKKDLGPQFGDAPGGQ